MLSLLGCIGCLSCDGPSTCTECDLGLYLNGTHCDLCQVGCSICTSSTLCQTCFNGLLIFGNVCYNVSNCNSLGALDYCSACSDKYFLKSGRCFPCEQSCAQCSTYSKCTKCTNGAAMLNNRYCENCNTQFAQCISCNSTQCLKCSHISYLKFDYTCELCSVRYGNCLECSSTACTMCKDKYYLDGTGACALGSVPFCSTGTVLGCTSCIEGALALDLGSKVCYLEVCLLFLDNSAVCDICKPLFSRTPSGQCIKETIIDADCMYWYQDKCIEYHFMTTFFESSRTSILLIRMQC